MSTHCQKKKPPPTNQTPTLSIEDVGSHPSGKPQCSNLGRLGMQKSKQWEFGPPCSYDVTLDIFPWKVSSFLTMLVSSCHCDPPPGSALSTHFLSAKPQAKPRESLSDVSAKSILQWVLCSAGFPPRHLAMFSRSLPKQFIFKVVAKYMLSQGTHTQKCLTNNDFLFEYLSASIHTKPLQWHVNQLFFCQPFGFFPTKKRQTFITDNHSSAGRPKSKYTRTSQSWWRDEKMISWSPHGLNQQLLSHVEKKTNKTKNNAMPISTWQFCDCDLFGMVSSRDTLKGCWRPPTRGYKGHFESHGNESYLYI